MKIKMKLTFGIIVVFITMVITACSDNTAPVTIMDTAIKPTAVPAGGNYTEAQTVTLSTATSGAAIYYTIDGTEPTVNSDKYNESVLIKHTATLKAIAVKSGMNNSDVLTEHYYITPPGQVVQPAASPEGGYFTTTQTVTLSTITEDAIIYYTLDESEPTAASNQYASPITIEHTTTLKAIAVKTDMHDSDVLTVNYTIIGFLLTNLDDIVLYLDMHTGTSQHPIDLPAAIELGTMTAAGSGWRNLLDIIAQADEFVNLDLYSCEMIGIEFNPDYSVVTGKNKIISIVLPNSAESIKDGTSPFDSSFLNFTALKSFHGDGLKSIGVAAFFGSTSLDMTSLPEGITLIDDAAFYGCTNLALTSLPEGVIYIGGGAFFDCRNLALTSLPEKITVINNQVFYNCKKLALTSLPEGVISIGRHAFNGCDNLALTTFPAGITSVGASAFHSCTNIEVITCLAVTPPTLGNTAFNNNVNMQIKVPAGSVEAYKSAATWSSYASKIIGITP